MRKMHIVAAQLMHQNWTKWDEKIVSGCEEKHLKRSGKINMYKPGKWEKLHHQGEEEVIGKAQVVNIVANICVKQQLCLSVQTLISFVSLCNIPCGTVQYWLMVSPAGALEYCNLGENGSMVSQVPQLSWKTRSSSLRTWLVDGELGNTVSRQD